MHNEHGIDGPNCLNCGVNNWVPTEGVDWFGFLCQGCHHEWRYSKDTFDPVS